MQPKSTQSKIEFYPRCLTITVYSSQDFIKNILSPFFIFAGFW